jgi:hypothetical protein
MAFSFGRSGGLKGGGDRLHQSANSRPDRHFSQANVLEMFSLILPDLSSSAIENKQLLSMYYEVFPSFQYVIRQSFPRCPQSQRER